MTIRLHHAANHVFSTTIQDSDGGATMRCTNCNSLMIETRVLSGSNSRQVRYECFVCGRIKFVTEPASVSESHPRNSQAIRIKPPFRAHR